MNGRTRIAPDDLAPLIARHAEGKQRILVAIAGPPGAGKSTLAAQLVADLNRGGDAPAIVVPMDGFHYDNAVLASRGLLPRKGAPPTFDVAGLAALLQRLAEPASEVAIPLFDRALDLARAGAAIVTPPHHIVVMEGNYLLLDEPPWADLAQWFDLTVAVAAPIDELERRLVRRWLDHGMSPHDARARALSNDVPNAKHVLAHSRPAHYLIANGTLPD